VELVDERPELLEAVSYLLALLIQKIGHDRLPRKVVSPFSV
jgi:hypothetical protein